MQRRATSFPPPNDTSELFHLNIKMISGLARGFLKKRKILHLFPEHQKSKERGFPFDRRWCASISRWWSSICHEPDDLFFIPDYFDTNHRHSTKSEKLKSPSWLAFLPWSDLTILNPMWSSCWFPLITSEQWAWNVFRLTNPSKRNKKQSPP